MQSIPFQKFYNGYPKRHNYAASREYRTIEHNSLNTTGPYYQENCRSTTYRMVISSLLFLNDRLNPHDLPIADGKGSGNMRKKFPQMTQIHADKFFCISK